MQWRQKLGCGVSGPVRPCIKKSTGERFALKCLIDKPRSRREVVMHFKCNGHPHIVSVFDCYANEVQFVEEAQPRYKFSHVNSMSMEDLISHFLSRPRLLLVMELMDGGELFDRISKQKHFTECKAAFYTKQVSFKSSCGLNLRLPIKLL